jgi:hypothetical protein
VRRRFDQHVLTRGRIGTNNGANTRANQHRTEGPMT